MFIDNKYYDSSISDEDYNSKDSNKMSNNEKIKLICKQRNQLAHKIQPEFINGEEWAKMCIDLVNQLYPDTDC